MATLHIAYAEIGPSPSKNNNKKKCFTSRAPIPLAPFRCTQIDAAQQRA
jgi:hypothetical protein